MNDSGVLFGVSTGIVAVVVYVWVGLSLSAVFAKAGEEGWKAWVPFLNVVVLLQLGGLSGWLVLLALIPLVGWLALWVALIMAYQRIDRAFGFGPGMTVLAALVFPVWSSIVGWGSARWLGSETAGPVRRGDTAPSFDGRVGSPILQYGVPPRPPAPVAAPDRSVPAAPAAPSPVVDLERPVASPTSSEAPIPAFRSSARAAAAAAQEARDEADDGGIQLGRSHAPFTQTVPTDFTPPADEAPLPAAPRRAFAPAPGEAPPPTSPFGSAEAPAGAPVAGTGAVAPVQSAPAAPAAPAPGDPWAPPGAEPVSAMATRATRFSPPPDHDASFDTSAEVSAVVGAPTLGAPRSARESVSAQHGTPEIPEVEAAFDETVLASRRRPAWTLTPPLGAPIAVTSDVLIIGRRPGGDVDFPDAQLVPVSDETRTMSKTHARLELQGDSWIIVDLDSTNGVILIQEGGVEVDATPGVPERLTERFLLGDAVLRLSKKESPSRSTAAEAE